MKFISTIQNHRGERYDLYADDGVNLVPHGAAAPALSRSGLSLRSRQQPRSSTSTRRSDSAHAAR